MSTRLERKKAKKALHEHYSVLKSLAFEFASDVRDIIGDTELSDSQKIKEIVEAAEQSTEKGYKHFDDISPILNKAHAPFTFKFIPKSVQ